MTPSCQVSRNTTSRGTIVGWTLLAVALSLGVQVWNASFPFGLFLPLLVGWLALDDEGESLRTVLVVVAVVALVAAHYSVTPTISVHFGGWSEAFFVAVGAAAAFRRRRDGSEAWTASLLRPHWRFTVWAALLVSWAERTVTWTLPEFEWGPVRIEPSWGLLVVTGAALGTARWDELLQRGLRTVAAAVAVALLVASLQPEIDLERVGGSIGSPLYGVLIGGSFLAAVTGAIGWRPLAVVWVVTGIVEFSLGQDPWTPRTIHFGESAYALSATLLGGVLVPFWRSRGAAELEPARALALLLALLGIRVLLAPESHAHPFVVGGAAFVAALVWRARALIATPLLFQLAYLLSEARLPEEPWSIFAVACQLASIGFVGFAFGFFGLLCNRLRAAGADAPRASRESPGAGRSIDVSGLAEIVRRLDESTTVRSFAAIVSVLLVVTNFGAVVAFFAAVGEEVFDEGPAIVAGVVGTALVLVLAPLSFLAADWIARQGWRHLTAITGAAIGSAALAASGGLFGVFHGEILGDFVSSRVRAAVAPAAFVLIGAWLLTPSVPVRRGIAVVLLGVPVAGLLAVVASTADPAQHVSELLPKAVALGFGGWLVVRSVLLRIVLSGNHPRGLFFSDLSGEGVWVRLGFLSGLPSSHWSARAMRRASFWLFTGSRPLVYGGGQLLGPALAVSVLWIPEHPVRVSAGVVLLVLGHLAFRQAKRVAARSIWTPGSEDDGRAPVLFLRSFQDDQVRFRVERWRLLRRWLQLWSFRRNADEALVDEIAHYGPIVALGRPGEAATPYGANRHYASDEAWQDVIRDTARRARAIVVGAAATDGVLWEYELLAREGLLDKTLLLFPPGPAAENTEMLRFFAKATSVGLGLEPPLGHSPVALLPGPRGPTLLTVSAPSGAACIAALRAYFMGVGEDDLVDPLHEVA